MPRRCVAQDDLLAVVAVGEVAERVEVDAGDLELGRRVRMHEPPSRRPPGRRPPRAPSRRAARRGRRRCRPTSAHSPSARIGGSEVRIRSSTTMPRLTSRPAVLGQRDVGPDADRHHHQCRGNDRPVGQLDALDLAVADDRLGVGLGHHLDAARLDRLLQQVAGGRVELALHQRRHDVQHGDVHAALAEAGSRFQAEQAAADDHRLRPRLRGEQHGVDVVEVAIGQHARQVLAGHRDDERHRTGGDRPAGRRAPSRRGRT